MISLFVKKIDFQELELHFTLTKIMWAGIITNFFSKPMHVFCSQVQRHTSIPLQLKEA
jgi:hypothetical protein